MKQRTSRENLWTDKRKMSEYLEEPLNQKLYQVYLGVKRKTPSQDFHTLRLFNEVYYICSRIIYENNPAPDLNDYIQAIKNDMGWDYPTSVVMQMVYAVLSLRKGNSAAVNYVAELISIHYRMNYYKTPFGKFVEEEKSRGRMYDVLPKDGHNVKKIISDILQNVAILINHDIHFEDKEVKLTLNIINHFAGGMENALTEPKIEIKEVVLQKHVETEIQTVESGGTGVNKEYQKD